MQNYLILGDAKKKIKEDDKKILSDACEALIGAIYIDQGFQFAKDIILKLWKKYIEASNVTILDPKTKLQEYSLKKFKTLPIYKFISDSGPKHKPNFKVAVKLKDTEFVEAEGSSKKLAQQGAATKLLNILEK